MQSVCVLCLKWTFVCVLLLTQIPVKNLAKEISGALRKSRFYDGNRKMLVNTSEGDWLVYFLVILPKSVHGDEDFWGTLISSVSFILKHICVYLAHYPANIYLFKVNNWNKRKKMWNMFKVNNKDTRRRHWRHNTFHIFFLVFPLLTLNN